MNVPPEHIMQHLISICKQLLACERRFGNIWSHSQLIICSESSVHMMSGIVITLVLMYFKRPPVAIRAYKNHYRRGNHAILLKWIDHIILGSSVLAISAQMERVSQMLLCTQHLVRKINIKAYKQSIHYRQTIYR